MLRFWNTSCRIHRWEAAPFPTTCSVQISTDDLQPWLFVYSSFQILLSVSSCHSPSHIRINFGPACIECFIEDEAFLTSYDLAPTPPPPHSPFSKLGQRHTGRLRKRNNLLIREGGREWGRCQTIYYGEKAWSSIKHSTVSDLGLADNRTGKEKRCIVPGVHITVG